MSSDAPSRTLDPAIRHRCVESFDGTPVHYDLYDSPSPATVILVPGFWRDRRHPAMRHIAGRLIAEGYRVAVVDLRGHGESGGTYGFNLHEHHDVAAVASDLLARNSTISTLALVGLSYGASISISVAARHDFPISALVLISAVADFEMIRPRLNPFMLHRHIALGQALRRPRFVWRARRAAKIRDVDKIILPPKK